MDKENEKLADKVIDYIAEGHTFTEAMEEFNRPVIQTKAQKCMGSLNNMKIADLK